MSASLCLWIFCKHTMISTYLNHHQNPQNIAEIYIFAPLCGDLKSLQWYHSVKASQLSSNSTVWSVNKSKHQSSALLCLCEGNPPVTGGFLIQRANNAESISILLHHHGCSTGGCPAQWANNLEMDVMKYLIRYFEWFIRVWVTMVSVSIMLGCSATMNTGLIRYLWQGLGREENSMGTLFSISVLSS